MAGKAPDDTEDSTLSLRKKPVRRATAKAAQSSKQTQPEPSRASSAKSDSATTTRTRRKAPEPVQTTEEAEDAPKPVKATKKAAETDQKVKPLIPKKITQVARARPTTRETEAKKPLATTNARPRRPLRTTTIKGPEKEAAPTKPLAKPLATARGRPRKESVKKTEEEREDDQNESNLDNTSHQSQPYAHAHATPKPAPSTARVTRSKTPMPDNDFPDFPDEPENESTPRQPETVSKAPAKKDKTPVPNEQVEEEEGVEQVQPEQESEDELDHTPQQPTAASRESTGKSKPTYTAEDESDDEICGPKTPMRRGWSPAKPSTTPAFGTAARRLQTPARRLILGAHRPTPQTQKIPVKPPAAASPQRPMTVARGISKPMVFRPLPRPEDSVRAPEPSPSKLPSEHEEQLDESIHVDHIQEQTVHDSESEDELHRSDIASTDDTDDDDELLLDAPNDNAEELDYERESPSHSDDEDVSGTDLELEHDDELLIQPQLPTELLHSSPPPATPVILDETDMDIDMSDASSSPAPSTPGSVNMHETASSPAPSTPGSVIVHRIAEVDTPTQTDTAPVPGLLVDEDGTDLIEQDMTTPHISSRMSFNTAQARMLQTPNMRGFRKSIVDLQPIEDIEDSDEDTSFNSNCIDPALLSTQDEAFDLAQEADYMFYTTPQKPYPTIAAQAQTMEPASAIPGRLSLLMDDTDNPRMSLLVDSLNIAPADYDTQVSENVHGVDLYQLDDIDMYEPGVGKNKSPEQAVDLGAHPIQVRDFAEIRPTQEDQGDAKPVEECSEQEQDFATPIVPRYMAPTVTSEARRRCSLPAFGSSTPQSALNRPVTADTTIKPITSEAFATLWAAKSKAGRRSSIRQSTFAPIVTPTAAEVKTPVVVSSTRKSTRKTTRKARFSEAQQPSVQIHEQPATPEAPFSGPRPRKHTPSASFDKPETPQPPPKTPMKTPMKTPLKAPGATPASFPMTPHPSQPLRSVTALVEVFTLDGSSASAPFIALLQRLGARTTKTWNDRVTHVVFKDGSPATLQKVRVANKDQSGKEIFCVNSRWVTDCDKDGKRMDERSEEYAVDVDDAGTKSKAAGRHRRRKSMEPASLRNIDGNVVATDGVSGSVKPRRQSISRKSMARVSLASTFWGTPGMSPVKGQVIGTEQTPSSNEKSSNEKENAIEDDDSFWNAESEAGTPIIPGYMNRQQELEMLQRTAPVNRMKKLRLKDGDESRRLTFLGGSE